MIMRLHRGRAAVLPSMLAALLMVTVLALSGCTSFSDSVGQDTPAAASSTPPPPKAQPIHWNDCDQQIQPLIAGQAGSDRDLKFECGRTEVPINYEEPGGA